MRIDNAEAPGAPHLEAKAGDYDGNDYVDTKDEQKTKEPGTRRSRYVK